MSQDAMKILCLPVKFVHHLGYFLFQFIQKLCPAFLPVPDFKKYPVEITNLNIKKSFAAESDVFQVRVTIIKAFSGI